jgi:hypothetical protein
MCIKYFNEPFLHTVINDFFNTEELNGIFKEIISIEKPSNKFEDLHHDQVNAQSYSLDNLYDNRRNHSFILELIKKIYQMDLDCSKNSLLNYIGISNADNTVLHAYANGASYFEHHDNAVLSFVYTFKTKPYTGGDLMFGDYKPTLEDNSLIIFPSYERHYVTPIVTKEAGVVRYSINQRIFIKN